MRPNKTLRIAFLGVFTALVVVMTALPKIPVPQTNGYINLGDSMILLSVVFFGGPFGAIVGAFGSAIADIISGYSHWAPYTFVIKGIEPLMMALILMLFKNKRSTVSVVVASIPATALMVCGYFIVGTLLYDKAAAMAEVPGNLIQAGGSIVICFLLFVATYKPITNFIKTREK